MFLMQKTLEWNSFLLIKKFNSGFVFYVLVKVETLTHPFKKPKQILQKSSFYFICNMI